MDRHFLISYFNKLNDGWGFGHMSITASNGGFPTMKYIIDGVMKDYPNVTGVTIISIQELNKNDFNQYLSKEDDTH
jgi:hypothetical protein